MTAPFRNVLAAAAFLGCTSVSASAFTFSQINDGSNQRLTWLWEYQASSFHSCLSSPSPCGNVLATQGRIPLQGFNSLELKAGGMLDWTASSGSLKVVVMPTVMARPLGGQFNMQWANAWGAIDARATPLDFVVTGEPGDPFPLDLTLQIYPRLLGNVEHYSYLGGSEAELYIQVDLSVSLNGQIVTRDTLTRDFVRSDGQQANYALSMPKGAGNSVLIPGITNGSWISIQAWIYARTYATTPAFCRPYSDYGDGPALEIVVRNASAVGVEDESVSANLSLAASPNPARGSARVSYTLPRDGEVRLSLYDVAGHRVSRLRDRHEPAGRREIVWNGRDENGRALPAGVYLLELVTGTERRTRRLVVLSGR